MRGIKTKERDRWKKITLSAILLIALIFLLNSVRKVYEKKREVDKALTQMEMEVAELEKRGEHLEYSLQKLSTREGMEFEIRKKLNVAQAGENVVVIVDKEGTTTTSELPTSLWQKAKRFFRELFE
jgi:hypothetical protein